MGRTPRQRAVGTQLRDTQHRAFERKAVTALLLRRRQGQSGRMAHHAESDARIQRPRRPCQAAEHDPSQRPVEKHAGSRTEHHRRSPIRQAKKPHRRAGNAGKGRF